MDFDLVFEGGGAKGLAFVGALKALERHGHRPRRVIGTSAGSITALLVAAGYSAEECMAAINERTPNGRSRFASFLQIPEFSEQQELSESLRRWIQTEEDNPMLPNFIEPLFDKMVEGMLRKDLTRHLISLVEFGGWYGGENLLIYLKEKLDAADRCLGDSTLSEFAKITGRDLSVVASDITSKKMLVLNHHTAPACPTIWAVRMSMSCPLVWQEVIWRKAWGNYSGIDISGHTIVDGGLTSNFPIKLLLSGDLDVVEIMGDLNSLPENVIGLLLDDDLEVPGAQDAAKIDSGAPSFLERSDLLGGMVFRLQGMAETLLASHDKSVLDAHEQLVCRLPARGYGILEFDLTPERMAPIVQAGEAAMEAHLAARFPAG